MNEPLDRAASIVFGTLALSLLLLQIIAVFALKIKARKRRSVATTSMGGGLASSDAVTVSSSSFGEGWKRRERKEPEGKERPKDVRENHELTA